MSNTEIQDNYLSLKHVGDVCFQIRDGKLDMRTTCLCSERLIIVCSHYCLDGNS